MNSKENCRGKRKGWGTGKMQRERTKAKRKGKKIQNKKSSQM
jgi:hypothetical protein